MNLPTKHWIKFALRWGIAVVGIWYVLWNINLSDRVMILDPASGRPVYRRVVNNASDGDVTFTLAANGQAGTGVNRDQLWTPPDRKKVRLTETGQTVTLLAVKPHPSGLAGIPPQMLLIQRPAAGPPEQIPPDAIDGGYLVQVPYPLVDVGISRRLREADPMLLGAAVIVFPITYLITGLRWYYLMRPLGISMTALRAFVLNMVGMFYSTFMPGSTGGDLVKAYYASKQTVNRTRAVMSVLVDRAIGLLSLILLGGFMATVQYAIAADKADAVAQSSLKVAILCGTILLSTAAGLVLFFTPWTRRWLGLDLLLSKLPMQQQVQRAIEVMAIYRQHKFLAAAALIGTLPVHATVVLSAMLAGMAFDLPLPPAYYFVAVPVIVLVGSIPISPQGAGVMEFFAIRLTERHGATIAQAFILTMSIRLVQVFWNLLGGLFVLKGGFTTPPAESASDPASPLDPASSHSLAR